MRLLKESVLQVWKARQAEVRSDIANAERQARAIQNKLDRLDEAFLFERSIGIETYDRHSEKLRAELTLVRMDRHAGHLDELDVEGVLTFAERILPLIAVIETSGVSAPKATSRFGFGKRWLEKFRRPFGGLQEPEL